MSKQNTYTDRHGREYWIGYVEGWEMQITTRKGDTFDYSGWYVSYRGSIDCAADVLREVSNNGAWIKDDVHGPFDTAEAAHAYANNDDDLSS